VNEQVDERRMVHVLCFSFRLSKIAWSI